MLTVVLKNLNWLNVVQLMSVSAVPEPNATWHVRQEFLTTLRKRDFSGSFAHPAGVFVLSWVSPPSYHFVIRSLIPSVGWLDLTRSLSCLNAFCSSGVGSFREGSLSGFVGRGNRNVSKSNSRKLAPI